MSHIRLETKEQALHSLMAFCCGAGGGDTICDHGEEHKFRVLESRWLVEKEAIGEGGFGTVHLCTSIKTKKGRACKAMRLPTPQDREDFRHEVFILRQVKTHHNIWVTL